MRRRQFLSVLGRVGVVGGAVGVGVAADAQVAAATDRSRRENGAYAFGPRGTQSVVWSVPEAKGLLAVTFDDGPLPSFTEPVLDALAAAGAPATFFMIGRLVQEHPELARRVAAAGHEVGSHSWSHASAPTLSDGRNMEEIDAATDAIHAVVGVAARWYRPPRGMLTGAAVRRAHERGQRVAMWSVNRGDEVGDADSEAVRNHLVSSAHDGAVVDLHDGVGASGLLGADHFDPRLTRRRRAEIEALPEVLTQWRAAGYRFVTLSDLTPEPTPPPRP